MEFHDASLALSIAGNDEGMCFARSDDDTLMMARPAS